MKHFINKKLFIIIVFAILLCLNAYLLYLLNQYLNRASVRTLANAEKEFTSDELKLLKDDNIAEIHKISGSKDKGEIKLEEPLTGRSTVVNEVAVWGNASLVFEAELLAGTYELWSSNQCIISDKAANEIFKSTDVEGLQIVNGNNVLTICGIFKYNDSIIITQANKKETFNCLEIIFVADEDACTQLKNMLNRNSIYKDMVFIDHAVYVGICRMLLMSSFFITLHIIFVTIKKHINDRKLYYLQILIFGFIILFLLGQTFRFPPSFIPGKWSNIDFWTKTVGEIFTTWRKTRKAAVFDKDLLFFSYVRFSIGMSILIDTLIIILFHKLEFLVNFLPWNWVVQDFCEKSEN